MANSLALAPVEFHGVSLITTVIDKVAHVALKVISDALGLDWSGQLQRIKRHPVLSTCMVVTPTQIPGDDQVRDVVFLPLGKLNGWLFGISVGRVKLELRDTLVQYQRECFDVLAQHFGNDQPSSSPYAVLPGQTLSAPQADTLRDLLTDFAKSMPKDLQGQIMIQGWSKLKAHFGTDYRHIPAAQFPDAVSILSRHIAGWAPADPKKTAIALTEDKPAFTLRNKRWLVYFDCNGVECSRQIHPEGEFVMPSDIHGFIRDAATPMTVNNLINAAQACLDRLKNMCTKGPLSA